jgi:hypothetical protein
LIEQDFESLVVVPGGGHDGQFSYTVAVDPLARQTADLYPDPAYRHRRILYSFLSGWGGLLRGPPVLTLLIFWAMVGVGLAAASLVGLLERRSGWWLLLVLANPGVWLSAQLLTPDALGLGLAMAGIALWTRRHIWPAALLFALAALTKDQFLLIPIVIAAYELATRKKRARLFPLFAAAIPLIIWADILELTIGGGFSPRANLGPPLLGIIEAARTWGDASLNDQTFTALTMLGLVLALAGGWLARRKLIGWLALSWAALALISSSSVWNLGSNSMRVFAILWILGGIAIAAESVSKKLDPLKDGPSSAYL